MASVFEIVRGFIENNVNAITASLYEGYTGDTIAGDDPTVLADAVGASINNRITALEGGGVLTQYTSSATWTKPTVSPVTGAAYQADDIFTVICINGGTGGAKPLTGSGSSYGGGAPGGPSGGYVSKQIRYADLPSTVAMTAGAAGAGATTNGASGSDGGTTSFGSLVVGTQGLGAVYKDDGSYATSIPPGRGGRGAATDSTNNVYFTGEPGQSGPFAVGGESPNNGTGAAGAAAPAGIPSGGGGGGGGGLANAGGAGGFPGGGGGGGGRNAASYANGGPGGAGCLYVIAPY